MGVKGDVEEVLGGIMDEAQQLEIERLRGIIERNRVKFEALQGQLHRKDELLAEALRAVESMQVLLAQAKEMIEEQARAMMEAEGTITLQAQAFERVSREMAALRVFRAPGEEPQKKEWEN